jgi:tetratricopeptide (TPR) repeat protein
MAEALALLGDDAGVLAVWSGAEQEGFRLQDVHMAYLHHLAAVAAYRMGDEKRARELWARCLRAAPNFTSANECIEDLDRPVGAQNGPWPCSLEYLLSPGALGEVRRRFIDASAVVQDTKLRDDARRFLQQHPEVQTTLPVLLECGDPLGRELAVRLAGAARTPQTLAVLRDFALSQRGADLLRVQAAQALVSTELSPGPEVRLWLKGQWRPFRLLPTEIHRDVTTRLPPRAEKLVAEGVEALKGGDPVKAEAVFRQAQAQAPDTPTITYNLANALTYQGRHSEADALVHALYASHPDYLFGVLHRAREHLNEGQTDEAARLIDAAMARPRLHVTEFSTLAISQIQLALARRQGDAARDWLLLLEAIDPDDRNLAAMRTQISASGR